MTAAVDLNLAARINQLERRVTRHRAAFVFILLLGAVLGAVVSSTMPQALAQTPGTDGILKVRGLIVVDERGVERVRLGAPLPDPIVEGKRSPQPIIRQFLRDVLHTLTGASGSQGFR
jgi:hypothetical protein